MSDFCWIELQIDAGDTVDCVNKPWSDFADANDSPGLADAVVGTSLWQHILGNDVQSLYRGLIGKVRRTGQAVEFPFRCDSPECKRILIMRMEPLGERRIIFRSRIVRETPRERVSIFDRSMPGSALRLPMCAICCRVQVDNWIEVEDAVRTFGLFGPETRPSVSYTICVPCRKSVTSQPEEEHEFTVEELFGPEPSTST